MKIPLFKKSGPPHSRNGPMLFLQKAVRHTRPCLANPIPPHTGRDNHKDTPTMNRISFKYGPDDTPEPAVESRTFHVSDPALTHRNFVASSDIRKLIRECAPRAEIEKLSRLGGWQSR
jgi:hypothetical protein